MQSKLLSISKLKSNTGQIDGLPANPRVIRDEKFHKLVKSIQDDPEMLELRELIVVPSGKIFVVIAGNMRLRAMESLGYKEAPCKVLDADTPVEKLKAYTIKDNVGFGEHDWDQLANEWDGEQLQEWGLDIPVDFGAETNEGLTDPDEVPEVPKVPVTALGDVWVLGKHRLMCGDSCRPDDVDRLMGGGKKADMLFTDPPWNVNYGDVEQGNAQGYKVRTIINDHMTPENWAVFVGGFTEQFRAATKPGAPAYVVMSAQEWPVVDGAIRNAGFHWSSTIIWVKDSLVLSRKDYHTRYEPIWYGWNAEAPRLVHVTDRKQDDVWEINRPKVSELHPTTKPVELIERAIKNSSQSGAMVLDLFGGSGSTLIACEAQGREARLMELDTKYADVIVKRWQDFTGQQAIHEATGKTFVELSEAQTTKAE